MKKKLDKRKPFLLELTKQNHEAIFNEDEFKNLLDDFEFVKNSKKIEYCNVPFAFDIETTSFYQNDEKKAIMDEAIVKSTIPDDVDVEAVNRLLIKIREKQLKINSTNI